MFTQNMGETPIKLGGILLALVLIPGIPPKSEVAYAAENIVQQEAQKSQEEILSEATTLNDDDLVAVLKIAGFTGTNLREAWAISKAESNGRPLAFNGNVKTGDNSYGIFQINMLGILGQDRLEKFNLDKKTDLFNPVESAKIAFYMSQGGRDWSSWSTYGKSRYRDAYAQYAELYLNKKAKK